MKVFYGIRKHWLFFCDWTRRRYVSLLSALLLLLLTFPSYWYCISENALLCCLLCDATYGIRAFAIAKEDKAKSPIRFDEYKVRLNTIYLNCKCNPRTFYEVVPSAARRTVGSTTTPVFACCLCPQVSLYLRLCHWIVSAGCRRRLGFAVCSCHAPLFLHGASCSVAWASYRA